ncbi:MAG: threonine--tRNA ligase [Pseudomonadota bacterium]
MPKITLPDGSERKFENPVSVHEVAADIGPGLAKAALAGKIDEQLVDTSFIIKDDCDLAIITDRDAEGLDVIRHSSAHLLAQAVKILFPSVQVTIGPVIEDGFYYDFAFDGSFSSEDLVAIEKKMNELAKQDIPVSRETMMRDDAVNFFREMGEEYKAEIIASIPQGEEISLYRQGDFIDLCRGPHVPSTGKIKAFKLMKVAGAYWRGDSNNPMLQRIYGTAWNNKKDLKQYLHRLEEAERRDHRKIGKQLDFFHFQEEAPGMVFWHQHGWTIFKAIESYMRETLDKNGYQEVKAPQVIDKRLWERSGHWDKFKDMMFTTESEHKEYAIKPMNCPGHIQIFNQGLKSYRDLPLKMAEFGSCHRNEPSGGLHGLMRVRSFTQDDAHVFCTEDQIQEEVVNCINMIYATYSDFGFKEIMVKLSTRPEKRVGADELWDKAEKGLEDALNSENIDWELQPGEGAFYGPKIEFVLKDCLGRHWQCGTVQVDFSMPGRLGASYKDENSERQVPVMLHRAILGSLERFIGILIEEYAGKLPTWLCPVQAVVLNITDSQSEYVGKIVDSLKNHGIRAVSDLRNEKIGFKIREQTLKRVPYLLVVGDRERENGEVAVRTRAGKELGTMPISTLIDVIKNNINEKITVEQED